jgi:hypothetical protein
MILHGGAAFHMTVFVLSYQKPDCWGGSALLASGNRRKSQQVGQDFENELHFESRSVRCVARMSLGDAIKQYPDAPSCNCE